MKKYLLILTSLLITILMSEYTLGGDDSMQPATGPLKVLPSNPRYFTDGSGRAIYLTGAHTWDVLKDKGDTDPPPQFDYTGYLEAMKQQNHNFLRLWTWDLFQFESKGAQGKAGKKIIYCDPFPWQRTGPGLALDGKPKFDLSKFNQEYFDRLRQRSIQAGQQGIYVAVMLFEGYGVAHSSIPWCWKGHPMNKENNINKIDANPNNSQRGITVNTLQYDPVTRIQEEYVRKVIETVNDLDNVLYEICNEAGDYSTAWQYHMIRFVKECEKDLPRQHPVGMTYQFKGGRNEDLFISPADWISPGPAGGYKDNPPPADGKKVIITDTDHLWGIGGNPLWVWKSFLRGMNPIYMEDYRSDDPAQAAIREALGHTMQMARQLDLSRMTPRGELASTGYCLADPGRQYLVLQPDSGKLTLVLPDIQYAGNMQWFDITNGKLLPAENIKLDGPADFMPPFSGPAALLLNLQ